MSIIRKQLGALPLKWNFHGYTRQLQVLCQLGDKMAVQSFCQGLSILLVTSFSFLNFLASWQMMADDGDLLMHTVANDGRMWLLQTTRASYPSVVHLSTPQLP